MFGTEENQPPYLTETISNNLKVTNIISGNIINPSRLPYRNTQASQQFGKESTL